MAQSLKKTYSPTRCVRLSKRFIRMCNQFRGADELTPDVQNAVNNVLQKESIFNAADENMDYAYDVAQLKDSALDNGVRDTAEASKKFDRDNPSSQVYSLIFPQHTLPIIDKHFKQQPAEVSKLTDRIRNLGPDHPIQQNASQLQQLAKESIDAIQALADAEGIRNSSQADLNAAKFELIKTYNNTILKSIQLFGKNITDKLFPNIKPNKKIETEIPSEDSVPVA